MQYNQRNANAGALTGEARKLKAWLFDAALPLWWEVGADRFRGGFHEAIDLAGNPVAKPHRARSIARQAFAFFEAGRLGWEGPWRPAAGHALHFFEHFVRPDGCVISVVKIDGSAHDTRFDLYNQAFALLAYAVGERLHGPGSRWRERALALRSTLQKTYAHPLGGHVEDSESRLPPCANPHMHLFEAALVWSEIDGDAGWQCLADEIGFLCLEKFTDRASGALREHLLPIGRPRRESRDAFASPVTSTSGLFCSTAGQRGRTAAGRRRRTGWSTLPIDTVSTGTAGLPLMQCSPMVACTTRWRGYGRRRSAFVLMSLKRDPKRRLLLRSQDCGVFSVPRSRGCGSIGSMRKIDASWNRRARRASTTSSAPSRPFPLPALLWLAWPAKQRRLPGLPGCQKKFNVTTAPPPFSAICRYAQPITSRLLLKIS